MCCGSDERTLSSASSSSSPLEVVVVAERTMRTSEWLQQALSSPSVAANNCLPLFAPSLTRAPGLRCLFLSFPPLHPLQKEIHWHKGNPCGVDYLRRILILDGTYAINTEQANQGSGR